MRLVLLSASMVAAVFALYAAVVVVTVEITMGGPFADEKRRMEDFDSDGWQRVGASRDGTRQAMVKDLFARHPLVGMPEASVRELLGEPNSGPFESASAITYRLGPEPGLPVDDEWLILEVTDGLVSRTSIARD